jgi:hypothetical protein
LLANVHKANPTAYMFGWFISLKEILDKDFKPVLKRHALFQRVRNQHEHLLVLVQQEHDTEVPKPLVREPRACNEFQALNLAEMCSIAEHMDVQQLGDVVVSRMGGLFTERSADSRGLLLDECTLIGYSLAPLT